MLKTEGNSMSDFEHIKELASWDSGGGMVLDLITLKDDRIIVVSDEAIVLYPSMEAFEAGEAEGKNTIFLNS
jgi:hypothetical protein